MRHGDAGEVLVCVANLSPVPRHELPDRACPRRRALDRGPQHRRQLSYGGSGVGNLGAVVAEDHPAHGQPASACLTLPPLAVVWLEPEEAT